MAKAPACLQNTAAAGAVRRPCILPKGHDGPCQAAQVPCDFLYGGANLRCCLPDGHDGPHSLQPGW